MGVGVGCGDWDGGSVQELRNAVAEGGHQYRTLRDSTEVLEKKAETATGAAAKRWQLKLGISLFFLGHLSEAIEHLKQAEGALANFYLGRALADRLEYDEAIKAFDRAEKSVYTASQVQLQKPGILRQMGDLTQARALLKKLEAQPTHSAEYHFQLASCHLVDGDRKSVV